MKLAHLRLGDDSAVEAFHIALERRDAGEITWLRRGRVCTFNLVLDLGEIRLEQCDVSRRLRNDGIIIEALLKSR